MQAINSVTPDKKGAKLSGRINVGISKTNILFEKNEFKDLRLRSTIGTGVGYQFYESEMTNLFLEAGLGYVNNDFIIAEDSDTVAGRWALSFDRYLFKKTVQFFHFHEGYQGLQDTEELFVRSHTGFRFPLKNGFLATLQYSYDWDKNPSPGQEDYDAKYIFTLGYEFQ